MSPMSSTTPWAPLSTSPTFCRDASPTRSSGRKKSASTSKTSKPKRFAPRRHKPVAHESLSLVEVCHDTIARMKPLAKSKQVKIRFEVRTALVRVHGVKELLETALCNFIINSITALDLANVTSRLVIIRILTPNPAETAIQVLDNGIGIPGSIRDKVFEPFVTTRPDGSDLGLAIAGDIIRLHHGQVSCRRRKTGTCMEIILPQEALRLG